MRTHAQLLRLTRLVAGVVLGLSMGSALGCARFDVHVADGADQCRRRRKRLLCSKSGVTLPTPLLMPITRLRYGRGKVIPAAATRSASGP